MRYTRIIILVALALQACSTTFERAHRVKELHSAPDALLFVWSAWRQPEFSNLPALSVAPAGTPGSRFLDNYPSEHSSFGMAIQQGLSSAPSVRGLASVVVLPVQHTPAQHSAAMNQAKKSSAVVLMYPERVTSYCLPGCYAFKVRVSYLSPVTRAVVWTGLIDSPPKSKHDDPFDSLAANFTEVLLSRFAAEGLLPR